MWANNLLLSNRKNKDQMWFVSVPTHKVLDMKAFSKHVGYASWKLQFVNPQKMEDLSLCIPGTLNCASIFNFPKETSISVIIDKELADSKWVGFIPMKTTHSMAIQPNDIKKIT